MHNVVTNEKRVLGELTNRRPALHNVVNADGDNLAIGSALTAKYFAKAPKLFYNFLERGPGAQIMI